MNDLETLRPEVREAMVRLGNYLHITIDGKHFRSEDYDTIRAELLRLSEENNGLREYVHAHGVAIKRAEKAEADLAALKARIADAPVYEIPLSKPKSEDGWARVIESVKNERSVRGKRVRLVVEE